VLIYRLSRSKHPALDGEGARLYGGRWNSAGRPVVYASATVSLAALERLVHLSLKTLPPDLVAYGIDVPDDLAVPTIVVALPADWRTPGCAACRDAGDTWLVAGTSAVLRAPSAVVAGEFNFLVNPLHPDITRLAIRSTESFAFDARLLRR
jgi:RES domain-containing protein